MIKTTYLLSALMAGGLAVLAGCSTASTFPTAPLGPPSPLARVPSAPAAVPIAPTLVGILWKMATIEKEASPEKILPYFGITTVPPVKMVREGYGWFAIDHQPPRFVSIPLHNLGAGSLYYAYNQYSLPLQETDYYSIRLLNDTYCVSADETIAVFGKTFKRLPARIYTHPLPKPQAASASGVLIEKGSLNFESGLFGDRGSVTFQFDSAPCAEQISINHTKKNK